MSESTDKSREPVADLPNPELNPLLNPVLSRHLGDWAHVYFTTPPERREDALFELLEELKDREARQGIPGAANGREPEFSEGIYAIVCPHCEQSNVRSQKYCGMCGSRMPVRAQAAAAATGGTLGKALFDSAVEDTPHVGGSPPWKEPTPTAVEAVETENPRSAFAATSLLFQPEPLPVYDNGGAQPQHTPVDIDWLRERNAPKTTENNARLRGATYALAILVAVCGAYVLYSHFTKAGLSESHGAAAGISGGPPASPASITPPRTENPKTYDALPSTQPAASQLHSQGRERQTHANEATYSVSSHAEPQVPSSNSGVAGSPPPANDLNQSGAAELTAAKGFLSGKNGAPDSTAAAKLLWKAVGKQNPEALLMLSDLYASGTGVPKSCDQARLLLNVALHRNVAAADSKLRELRASCP